MPEAYLCEIVAKKNISDVIVSVSVAAAGLAETVRAGQFIHIRCGDARILRRPFGVCSLSGGVLEFVFEIKGGGTRWLSGRSPGDLLDILGPLGNGYRIGEGNIIVVGGGLGSPPMLFAAMSAKGTVTAVLGFRELSRVMMVSEYEAVCEKVYVTTDDGSYGIHGTVATPLTQLLERGGYETVLACGQRAMLAAVAELCAKYGVPCQVSMEERMGCGVGACVVCACATMSGGVEKMSRVCKDGPVFDASEVFF